MTQFTMGDIQLALQIGHRTGLCPCRRFPPCVGRGKDILPGIKPIGFESQFLGDHGSRLATVKPVLDGFTFKGIIEFTTDLDGCFFYNFHSSLFTQFSVRQIEATPVFLFTKLKKI